MNDHESSTADDAANEEQRPTEESPLNWILNSKAPQLQLTMVDVRDKELPQRLVDYLSSIDANNKSSARENDGAAAAAAPPSTECVKLVMCKGAPIIWGMQRAIAAREEQQQQQDEDVVAAAQGDPLRKRIDAFFQYLPELKEFEFHGEMCEQRYKECTTPSL